MQKGSYKTIFAEQGPQQINHNNPLFYFEHRHDFLSALSDKYSAKYRLPTMELKRNARVDYYLDRYNEIKKKVEKQESIHKAYLNSDQYDSVFVDCIDETRKKKRQKKQQQKLKRDLMKFYQEQKMHHQPPQHDKFQLQSEQEKQNFRTVLVDYRTDLAKQKQLYLLDLQIGKLTLQQKIQKKVKQNRETCRNSELLSKLSNNILSAYMLNFDQIYNALIDEILVEQVYYLNYLQAQYKVQKSEWPGNQATNQDVQYQNAKTIKMMELVKTLDDLCDQ